MRFFVALRMTKSASLAFGVPCAARNARQQQSRLPYSCRFKSRCHPEQSEGSFGFINTRNLQNDPIIAVDKLEELHYNILYHDIV